MLRSQHLNGERGIDPVPFDDGQEIVIGTKVGLFVEIHRLRKDGSRTERWYRTYVYGEVIGTTPKRFRVRWEFTESVGERQLKWEGFELLPRHKLFQA